MTLEIHFEKYPSKKQYEIVEKARLSNHTYSRVLSFYSLLFV
jgi:hypothetical protein